MGENFRLIRAIPGPSSLRPLVAQFARAGEGSVTSLDDSMLPVLRAEVDDDSGLEVVPFGKLVGLALDAVGEERWPLATTDQYAAAIGQAARNLREDSELRKAVKFPGIRKAIVRTLGELGEWGIDLDVLLERAEGTLYARVQDLRDLQEGALGLLKEIGRDTHIRQVRACEGAISDPESRPTRILVFIGAEAPPAKLDWLRWAAEHGSEVWVVVERHATDGTLFTHGEGIAERLDVHPQEIGTGNRLLNNLFAQTQHGGTDLAVRIASSADPLAECEWALRGCLALVGDASAAIYVRSLESYAPLLKASAERLGLQVRVQSRVPLLENAFARLSLQILEACAGNDVRRFGPTLRSSYLALSGSQRSQLQAALMDARVRRSRQWEELATWLAGADEKLGWLLKVLRWRESAIQAPTDLGEWLQRLRELVGHFPWHEALEQPAGYDSKRDVRAFTVMHGSLDNEAALGKVGGESSLSLPDFARRCRAIWEAADVSVPAAEEGIPVVSSALSIGGADAVFVLGVLEGVFPRRRTEEPILSDEAREAISALMPEQPPLRTSRDIAAAERDEFYRVCAASSSSITFSYPETGEDRDNIPAFYLEVVKQAVDDRVPVSSHPRAMLAPEQAEALAPADMALREALEGDRQEPPGCDLTTEAASQAVHPPENEPIRPSALRDMLQCPFRYQMRDRLRIPTRSRLAHWSKLRNLPQAAGLVRAGDIEEAKRLLEQALETQLDLLIAEAPDWELKLLRSGGTRLIREWLKREFKARAMWPRDGTLVDVKIGEHGTRDDLPGGTRLEGLIPAVSALRGGAKLLHLYGMRTKEEDDLTDADRLYMGLYFGIGFETGRETALEIEGISGKRSLIVLSRAGIGALRSDHANGLQVIDLSTSEDPADSKRQFFNELKALRKKALGLIARGEIAPEPGDHCDTCDFGELCRRSLHFSDDDSPFGQDEELGAA